MYKLTLSATIQDLTPAEPPNLAESLMVSGSLEFWASSRAKAEGRLALFADAYAAAGMRDPDDPMPRPR
jgi:hypothetical protein